MAPKLSISSQKGYVLEEGNAWFQYTKKGRITENDQNGFKVHFGVDRAHFQRAINVILPLLCDENNGIEQFKIFGDSSPPTTWFDNAYGKEFCLYLHEGFDPKKLIKLLQAIEDTLKKEGIPPSPKSPDADRIIPGSHYHVGYRFDKPILFDTQKYYPADAALAKYGEKAYNPGNPPYADPFFHAVIVHQDFSASKKNVDHLSTGFSAQKIIADLAIHATSPIEKFYHFRQKVESALNQEYPYLIQIPREGLLCAEQDNQPVFLPLVECAKLPLERIEKLDTTYQDKIKEVKTLFSALSQFEQKLREIEELKKGLEYQLSSGLEKIKENVMKVNGITKEGWPAYKQKMIEDGVKSLGEKEILKKVNYEDSLVKCSQSLSAFFPQKSGFQQLVEWFDSVFKQLFSWVSKAESSDNRSNSTTQNYKEKMQAIRQENALTPAAKQEKEPSNTFNLGC